MTEFSDGLIVGLLIGTLVGIPIGWILAQSLMKPQPSPSSVVFDRDKEGKISSIHYVPVAAK
jgi:hypothetical protein